MARTGILLIFAIGAIGSGQPAAAAVGFHPCNTDRIKTELASNGKVTDLTGCKPETVDPILSNYDYGLTVESYVASQTVRAGRIVGQRVESSTVFVNVSTGPAQQQQTSDGPYTEGTSQPSNHSHDGTKKAVFGAIGAVLGTILTAPKKMPSPPAPEPALEPAPPPVATGQPIAPTPIVPTPSPPPPVVVPTPSSPPPVVNPTPTPPPQETQPAKPTDTKVAEVSKPPPPPVKGTPPGSSPTLLVDMPASLTTANISHEIAANLIPPPPPEVASPPPVLPAVFRLIIQGPSSVNEGDQLTLVIRREGRDAIGHHIQLAFSDPAVLAFPPRTTFVFGAAAPAEITVQLPTVAMKDGGDHDLTVTLASTDGSQIAQPASVKAVILNINRWEKLLQAFAAVPLWARALAAVVAAAAIGTATVIGIMPKATCSIGGGSLSLGGRSFKNRWPAIDIDVEIGEPTFFISAPPTDKDASRC
jgi:hypothetical protein